MTDPNVNDVLLLVAIRLPKGEVPFMLDALEDDTKTMNAVLYTTARYPISSVPDSDIETGLNVLGIWDPLYAAEVD